MKKRILKISREQEAALPNFASHDEARLYFKEIYKDNFQMEQSHMINEEKIYFYVLILNSDAYYEGVKEMVADGSMISEDFLLSKQSIEIHENGYICIIH